MIAACVQKAKFLPDVIQLNLTINEQLNNPDLTEVARADMRKFAVNLLAIGDGITIQKSTTSNEDVAPWEYGHVPENVLDELISKVYTDFNKATGPYGNDYLSPSV